jgi:predicted transcriptional regulator
MDQRIESKKALHVCCGILTSITDCTSVVEILKTRSRTEIIALILQALEAEPLTCSKIMYQAMLNFNQVKDYARFLTQHGLLGYVTLDRKYSITDKGRQFLALFNKTNQLLTTLDDDYSSGIDSDENYAMTADHLQVQNQQQQEQVTLHK